MEQMLTVESLKTGSAKRPGLATDRAPDTSLARGLRVLAHLALAARPVGVTEIARVFDVPKSNMHRQLNTLVAEGFVSRGPGGRYRASLKLWQLGLATYNGLGLVRLARPALEDLVEALLSDDIAHADVLGIVSGYPNGEISLGDLQDEVFPLLALDGPGFDRLDQRSTVVWIDDGVSDLKNHQFRAPFTPRC